MDAASRMFEIMDALPTVKEDEHPVHKENMRGDIELKNVSFEYEAGHPIIKNVSFKVQAGHMFGIVGKTGAGKSTIINILDAASIHFAQRSPIHVKKLIGSIAISV